MEMMRCPNCGRNVATGDRFCGGCRYPMAAACSPRKTFARGIRAGLVPAVGSWLGTVVGTVLWLLVAGWLMGYFLGSIAGEAMTRALLLLLPYTLLSMFVGAGMDLILYGCFANSRVGQILCGLVIAVALCFAGVFLAVFAPGFIGLVQVLPEAFAIMLRCVRGVLLALPLLQGALFCGGSKGEGRKAIGWQLLILAVFLLLQAVLTWVAVAVFALGVNGFLLAAVLGGVLTLLVALLIRCFK